MKAMGFVAEPWLWRVAGMLSLTAARALAVGGGGGERIVFVADSRSYTGMMAWFTNLYNESLASFTLLTIISVPVLAVVLSVLLGMVLARTGIDLTSRSAAGH